MKALEILEYFGAEEMVNNNTPFEEQDCAEAIEELEDLGNSTCNWYQDKKRGYKPLELNYKRWLQMGR